MPSFSKVIQLGDVVRVLNPRNVEEEASTFVGSVVQLYPLIIQLHPPYCLQDNLVKLDVHAPRKPQFIAIPVGQIVEQHSI